MVGNIHNSRADNDLEKLYKDLDKMSKDVEKIQQDLTPCNNPGGNVLRKCLAIIKK